MTTQRAASEVAVAAGSTVTGKDAQLEHGGRLTGTVTGRKGRPLKGITVMAYRLERGKWQYDSESTTAADGSYVVGSDGSYVVGGDGLLSGVYHLRFSDDSGNGYLLQYYGGASTHKAAANVVLGEDETVAGLDAHLAWPRTFGLVKTPKVTGMPQVNSPACMGVTSIDRVSWERSAPGS